MGYGSYSTTSRSVRADSLGYHTKSARETFKSRSINSAMNPHNITPRESCDSPEHPNTVPIVLGLDVTGSMGSIPHFLVKNGLPHLVDTVIQAGIKDPQLLFLGIGDHECDDSPLQVGQFESSDELLDKWLTDVWLEGGGGGNDGESYLLAWFLAAYYTKIDSFDKRGKKGFLFTIGDEPTLLEIQKDIPGSGYREQSVKDIMGKGQWGELTADALLEKAREKYNVFHLHITETGSGSRQHVQDGWKQRMGDNCIIVNRKEDVAKIIAETVIKHTSQDTGYVVENKTTETISVDEVGTVEEILL